MMGLSGVEKNQQPAAKGGVGQQTKADKTRSDHPAVLLVDDRPENLFALEAMLRRDDIDILSARSGHEALEILLARPIALAVIDVQMPEMDGFELAVLIRGVERTRHVPIIFVTAGSNDQRRVFSGYEAGAVDFLFKPIESQVLRSKVDVFVTLDKQRQELRRSEERFRTLVQTTSQAVWRTSADGSTLGDSPSFRDLTGMSAEDWSAGRWLDAVYPDDRERVRAARIKAHDTSSPYEVEYRLRLRDGRHTWTVARVAPLLDDRGDVVEWVGANADIHARKETEAVREMFVAILGHDLRNPLGAMLAATQLALTRTEDEAIRRPLRRVMSSGERIARMIEQLLDLTRVRLGGGIVLYPVEADFPLIVQQALDELPTAKERFRLECTGDMRGRWDIDRLFQLILNLAGNAVQHGAADAPIRIRVDGSRADTIELSVHNLGSPIRSELRPCLFDAFRGSAENKQLSSRGLGLGLFITKQLALAHGGDISFESNEETGTIFIVQLPRHCHHGRRRADGNEDSSRQG